MYAIMIINVIFLISMSFACGYMIGKGNIVIEKKVTLSEEETAKLEKMQREQQEAIDKYNNMIAQLSNFSDMGV